MADAPEPLLDVVFWNLARSEKSWTLAQAVNRVANGPDGRPPQVTVETVYTEDEHPFELFDRAAMFMATQWAGFGIRLVRFSDDEGFWTVAAFGTPESGVFHLVGSIPATHPRWRKVERWIASSHGISRCFLNHRDFLAIGDNLAEKGEVEVVRMTARVVEDMSSLTRGFRVMSGTPRPNHRQAIEEAESQIASVRTLTLHVNEVLHLHLRRIAGATYYSGDFRVFEEEVLSRLESAAAIRRALLTGRARQAQEPVMPFSIALERPVLQSAEDTGALIEHIGSSTAFSLAVFHRNPYLHIAVTDEVDGSNFDIMVTESQSIDVFPGFRASAAALSRISQELGERFGAREIVQREPRKSSLSELFSG